MKKFFGIGLLALLTTAYFTSSCSRDEFSGSMIEAKKEAFNSVFIETYGEPDPQHNWGFGVDSYSRAFTRSIYANGNEWANTYKVPPQLTADQKDLVRRYFQQNKIKRYEDPQLTDFFIQQVYKGGTNVPAGCPTPEQYTSANNGVVIGSNHMDHLAACNEDGSIKDHIYNFNYGTCSTYPNILNSEGVTYTNPNGNYHSDEIQLAIGSTTKKFGYFNSEGSLGHTDFTSLVSWRTIAQWAVDQRECASIEACCLNDNWNRSFMGFDYESIIGEDIFARTNEDMVDAEGNVVYQYDGKTPKKAIKYLTYGMLIDGPNYVWDGGEYAVERPSADERILYNGNPIPLLDNRTNMYCGIDHNLGQNQGIYRVNKQFKRSETQIENVEAIDLTIIFNQLQATQTKVAYYPVDEKGVMKWVEVTGGHDDYYSDWIVTLTKAERNDGGGDDPSGNFDTFDVQEITDGRIFCEDLGSAEATDIDYNDVVFDAFTYVTKTYRVPYTLDSNNKKVYDMTNISSKLQSTTYNKTDINLLAAGGTITIKVAGKDVNQLLGIDKTIMANTYVEGVSPNRSGYSNFSNGVSPVKFTVDNSSYTDLSNIPVAVRYGKEVRELTAYIGDVPQKFSAPVGTPWPAERVEFNSGFEGFQTWVNNRYATPWYTYVPDKLYNLKFASSSIRTVGGRITDAPTGNDAITVEGKGNNPGEEKFITVSLESTLAVGDQIAITGYRNRDDNAIGSLYLKFGDYIIKDEQVYNNKKYGSEPNTFVWTVTSDMAGCTSFQISRNKTGTNVYITDITIIGGFGAQDVDNNGGGNSNGNGGNNNGNTNGGGSDGDAPSFGTLTGTEVAVNTTTLSSNSNLTVSASDISNTPAATVYVYGTGDGSVYVNGVEATTVATRAAAGVVKSCTLTPKQMGLNGLSITGGNFTVYRLSYQATTLPAVSQPAGTVLFGGNGQSKNMANWGNNQFSVAGSSLSGLTDKTKIRVAGIGFEQGNDSWQVQIAVGNPWTVIGTQTHWTKGTDGAVTVEFELTQNQATALLTGGLIVQGINFIMKYVTVENPSSTGGDKSATSTITLITNSIDNNGGIVTDQSTARGYVKRIVAGTTRLVGKVRINANRDNNESWYFQIGPSNSGAGIVDQVSNNSTSVWAKNDVMDINVLIDTALRNKLVDAVSNDYYFPAFMTFQGNNVTLTELKFTNCLAAE